MVVARNQGAIISSFAVLVREGTYIPASLAAWRRPVDNNLEIDSLQGSDAAASLKFVDRRQSFQRKQEGLEYSSFVSTSPDGLHLYALEPETDSLSVWNVSQNASARPAAHFDYSVNGENKVLKREFDDDEPGSRALKGWPDESAISFVERRAHKEERIRFRGMDTSDPLTFDRKPMPIYTPDILCDLEPFDNSPRRGAAGHSLQMIGMAGGCQDLDYDHLLSSNDSVVYDPAGGAYEGGERRLLYTLAPLQVLGLRL